MKKNIKLSILILSSALLICLPILLFAQGPGDPGAEPAPIDGGASLILAAGIGYGAKKLKEAREKKNKEIE